MSNPDPAVELKPERDRPRDVRIGGGGELGMASATAMDPAERPRRK